MTTEDNAYQVGATGETLPIGFRPSSNARVTIEPSGDPIPIHFGQPKLQQVYAKIDSAIYCRDRESLVPWSIKEIARVRGARHLNCELCGNTRNKVAAESGITDEVTAMVADDYESSDLTELQKLAIRYADAVHLSPEAVPAPVREEMLQRFTPEQIVELTLFITQGIATMKQLVALQLIPDELPMWVH